MPRLVTFAIWALLAASAAYWALGASKVRGLTALPVASVPAQADQGAVARLLGQRASDVKAPVAAPTNNRFALMGVIARGGAGGAALIAVDGKPARPYRVGSEVDPGLVLQSVEARSATLASEAANDAKAGTEQGESPIRIELPKLENGGLSFGRLP